MRCIVILLIFILKNYFGNYRKEKNSAMFESKKTKIKNGSGFVKYFWKEILM